MNVHWLRFAPAEIVRWSLLQSVIHVVVRSVNGLCSANPRRRRSDGTRTELFFFGGFYLFFFLCAARARPRLLLFFFLTPSSRFMDFGGSFMQFLGWGWVRATFGYVGFGWVRLGLIWFEFRLATLALVRLG